MALFLLPIGRQMRLPTSLRSRPGNKPKLTNPQKHLRHTMPEQGLGSRLSLSVLLRGKPTRLQTLRIVVLLRTRLVLTLDLVVRFRWFSDMSYGT